MGCCCWWWWWLPLWLETTAAAAATAPDDDVLLLPPTTGLVPDVDSDEAPHPMMDAVCYDNDSDPGKLCSGRKCKNQGGRR
ncbi:MAG: hypothetical protein COA67_06860 [Lutibacter sp.]|nr:MAG: hypothetical protein COA67_06860 [Lutibacter sp.]